MKTKIILTASLFIAINYANFSPALAATGNCVDSGRTCVDNNDPKNSPRCPYGMTYTIQYICEGGSYHQGAICCETIPSDPAAPVNSSSNNTSNPSGNFPTSGATQGNSSLPPELYIPGSSEIGLPAPSGGITQIIRTFLTWALGIIGLIALISFIISGIQYMLAAGEDTAMQKAKRNMLYSIYGIVVALSGVIIIQAIFYALSGFSSF